MVIRIFCGQLASSAISSDLSTKIYTTENEIHAMGYNFLCLHIIHFQPELTSDKKIKAVKFVIYLYLLLENDITSFASFDSKLLRATKNTSLKTVPLVSPLFSSLFCFHIFPLCGAILHSFPDIKRGYQKKK